MEPISVKTKAPLRWRLMKPVLLAKVEYFVTSIKGRSSPSFSLLYCILQRQNIWVTWKESLLMSKGMHVRKACSGEERNLEMRCLGKGMRDLQKWPGCQKKLGEMSAKCGFWTLPPVRQPKDDSCRLKDSVTAEELEQRPRRVKNV